MGTATKQVYDNIYTKLDTATATALAVQNSGQKRVQIRVVFATSVPAITESAYFMVPYGKAISRDGMSGNMYGLSEGGQTTVTVGE